MPVDKNIADSMLGPFRGMLNDLEQKKSQGPGMEKLRALMARMEACASETDDVTTFSTRLATEGLYNDFSTAYTEVMTEAARKDYEAEGGEEKMMRQTLEAYESSLQQAEGKPYMDSICVTLREMIALGKSGVSYPVFLRTAEEKGLNDILQGAAVIREVLLTELELAKLLHAPLLLAKAEEILSQFDRLASVSPAGRPDSFEFGLLRQRIEWEYEPGIIRWNTIVRHWDRMLMMVFDWHDSYCSFAPYDQRWADLRGMEYTLKNIRRTQECTPGFLKVREHIFHRYFGLKWEDIFTHETYINDMGSCRIWFSDGALDIIRDTYPCCVPGGKPTAEIIGRAEKQHSGKTYKRPGAYEMSDEDKARFIAVFGEEKFNELYGRGTT